MLAYLARRVLATIPVMGVVALFVFSLLYLAPGDPAAVIAGDQATPADVERIRQGLGLDRPFLVRFGEWSWRILHGDMGTSIFTGLRLGLGLAWFVIVVGEMTGVPQGLGAVIMDGRTLSRTELVICGMIVIGLAGYISDRVVVSIGNYLLRWSPNHHG